LNPTTIQIDTLAHGGNGIGRIEGQVCFVPYGLPGDTLQVRIVRQTKSALWAEIDTVLEASPHRTRSACPHFGTCGGCTWGHLDYPTQAEWKQRIARDTLAHMGGIDTEVAWIEDPSLRLAYRTRAEFHGDGKALGFYARGSHQIVDVEACPLCHRKLNTTLRQLRDIGLKGTVTVTANPEGEEVMVWTKFTQRRLKHRFPLADTPKDERRSRFLLDGVPIVNGTFSQSSLLLNRLLVREAHAMIGKPVSLLDLYCGNGNLSLGLHEKIRVVGMDHNRTAVKAAKARHRGDYRPGDEAKMRKLLRKDEWDTVLLDPPRTGAKEIMETLAAAHARAIVYVSCDPATLARDLKILCAAGWRVTQAKAIDMFPYTPHVETLCRLER